MARFMNPPSLLIRNFESGVFMQSVRAVLNHVCHGTMDVHAALGPAVDMSP